MLIAVEVFLLRQILRFSLVHYYNENLQDGRISKQRTLRAAVHYTLNSWHIA